jgi:alpha-beta hydrolase superfamily lysophospholipase
MAVRKQELVRGADVRYRFRHGGFDFWFQWALAASVHGGSEPGECFFVATRISDGDPDSWVREWTDLGVRLEERAEKALARGHRVTAREAYLRAYHYQRLALQYLHVADATYRSRWKRAVRCFRAGTALLTTPVEQVAVPFEGTTLPGYFLRPGDSGERRPTLIMVGGGDTFVEDLYFYTGPAAVERGYQVLLVDLPGQGGLPFSGLPMRADAEVPMRAVVDHLLARPDVDPDTLAAFGISAGGYLVPRAATREPRIKACIAASAIPDFHEYMTQGDQKAERNARLLEFWPILALLRRRMRARMILIDSYLWRWGVTSPSKWLAALRTFVFDPARITCPLLLLIGQAEHDRAPISRAAQHFCLDQARSPRKDLVVCSYADGGWGHALVTNLGLMSHHVFDWLDEVFAPAAVDHRSTTRNTG